MKKSELIQIIREELRSLQELTPHVDRDNNINHTYEGIEDAIMNGICNWTGITRSNIWKDLSSNGHRALNTFIQELKPTLDKKYHWQTETD